MKTKGWTNLFAALMVVLMSGKVITPNGDGFNDRLYFDLSTPPTSTPQTLVADLRGRRLGSLLQESPTRFSWDGRDDSGRVAESGIYLFQIQQDNALWNGVATLAK